MSFIRKIKKGNSVYLAEVSSYREDGKVKQKVIKYLGKEVDGKPVRKVTSDDIEISNVKHYLDYYILNEIAKSLNLHCLLGDKSKYILLLVYTQLITRKSIYKLPEYIENTALKSILNIEKIIDKNLYEALDDLEDLDFNEIENKIFNYFNDIIKKKQTMIIDVTDTYFNGSAADWKSRKGKDGKYSKLIQIALAISKEEGFPIMHKFYEGNISNVKIFQDMILDTKLKNFEVVILDRGMTCYDSLNDLFSLNQQVITGLKMNKKIQNKILTKIEREEIYQPENRVNLKNTQVYAKEFNFEKGKLITIYNPELEVAKRNIAMLNIENYNSLEAKYMGYSLIYHTTNYQLNEVVKKYFERDNVEKAYREIKSNINLNPIRKYRMEHIKAHVKICYLAYAILSLIQYKVKSLNISASTAIEKLQNVYKCELIHKKENLKWSKVVTLSNEQKKILKVLNCSV